MTHFSRDKEAFFPFTHFFLEFHADINYIIINRFLNCPIKIDAFRVFSFFPDDFFLGGLSFPEGIR